MTQVRVAPSILSADFGRLRVAHEVVPLAAVDEAWRRQTEGTAPVRLVLTP